MTTKDTGLANGHDDTMPIAIVGMSFRGPGDASNLENFYKVLAEGRETWSPIPESKWVADAFHHPDPMRGGASNVRGGHFFKQDLSLFDAPFFGMREEEATCLDPQHRMLLECCYETLEDSGTPLTSAVGSNTAVFVGSFGADYPELLYRDAERMPMYQATNAGNSRAILSNRLSYWFDFKGPSVTIDTACSASLVAFHLACQSLRTGDADQAIVGGSSVILNSDLYISMSAMGFLSPEGRCYSFDERAQGYGRGEGVGCVLIKPLDKALRDGDGIRAIVRNTGSNQDGRTPGITFPSGEAQERLMRAVYEKAGLDPVETTYVEAHGTGTQAGDPVEAAAIAAVFGPGRSRERPLLLGSVKSNVGHLEGASGITSLIKAVLMVENGIVLPSRNFDKANSRIPLDEWKLQASLLPRSTPTTPSNHLFEIATELAPWQPDGPRRLSINSFGYGGSNAHAILEDASGYLAAHALLQTPLPRPLPFENSTSHANACTARTAHSAHPEAVGRRRIFVCSSFDQDTGREQARRLARYIRSRQMDAQLGHLAYTLSERRTSLAWKLAVSARSTKELLDALEDDHLKMTKASKPPTIAFVFTGQGAQWAGMGRELVQAFPAFRASLERARDHLRTLDASWDLIDELSKQGPDSRINLAELSQPICTALQCALVDLLASWSIVPAAVTGHSSGEIAAAYCIGAMSHEATMTAAYYRGIVAGRLATSDKTKGKGSMMAIALGTSEVEPLLDELTSGRVSVACENSPHNVTVSGDAIAIDELLERLKQEMPMVFARKLMVDVAYHSHHMQAIGDDYLSCIPKIEKPRRASQVQFYSSVTGKLTSASDLDPPYWVANLLGKVRFSTSLSHMCHGAAVDVLVEIGPHSALAGPVKQTIGADVKLRDSHISYLSTLVRNKDAVETAMALAGQLITKGVSVAVAEINNPNQEEAPSVLVSLPPYPWNHSRSYWTESRLSSNYRARRLPRSDVLGAEEKDFNPLAPRWRNVLRLAEQPWLRHHAVQSSIVYPAGGYIAMIIEAARLRAIAAGTPFAGFLLREVVISNALVITEDPGGVETAVTLRPYSQGTRLLSDVWQEFFIYSVNGSGQWTEHCRGLVRLVQPGKSDNSSNQVNGTALQTDQTRTLVEFVAETENACTRHVDVEQFYDDISALGLRYGPTFANVTAARASAHLCAARIAVPDTAAYMPKGFQHPVIVHPATIDSMLHPLFVAARASSRGLPDPMVPISIGEVFVSSDIPTEPGATLSVYASNKESGALQLRTSILVTRCGAQGLGEGPVARIDGLTCATLPRDSGDARYDSTKKLAWSFAWGVDPEYLDSTTLEVAYVDAKGGDGAMLPTPETIEVQSVGEWSTFHWARLAAHTGLCRLTHKAAWYIGLHGFKNPHLRLLEVGAVSGLATMQVLQHLDDQHGSCPRFLQYDLACQTPGHIEAARARLAGLPHDINFQKLDLLGPVTEQGFVAASYHVILATMISFDTNQIPVVLRKLRKLLRPDGKLILIELTEPEPEMGTGTEPRSVLGAGKTRASMETAGASMHRSDWSRLLVDAGFSTEYSSSCEALDDADQQGMLMINSPEQPSLPPPVHVLVVVSDGLEQILDVHTLKARLEMTAASVTLSTLEEADTTDKVCVVLAELLHPFMHAPSQTQFQFSKDVFLRSRGVLWVTQGAGSTSPLANSVLGVARTARSEHGATTIVTVDLDGEAPLAPMAAADLVHGVFNRHFRRQTTSSDAVDLEFREKNGRLLIPRLLEHQEVNDLVAEAKLGPRLEEQLLIQKDRPLRIDVETPGLMDSIRWVDDESATANLADDCIEVEVKAVGVNFRDVMMALGQIDTETLGGECSGTVSAKGKGVSGFAVGDRVAFLHLGSYATLVHPKACIVRHIPPNMAFETAAALPVIFVTAYYSLFELARLRKGETVLIHAAAGGVGQAAIELCQMVHAEVFVTVGSAAKKRAVMERFHIAEDHIFYSRDGSFAQAVATATGNRGVDVILNSVAGEAHRLTWSCIGPFGRFIELGKRDIFVNTRLEMEKFARNVTFATFDLVDLIRYRPDTCGRIWGEVLELLQCARIRIPSPIQTFPMGKIVSALQTMQSGKHMGKLVSVVSRTETVMVTHQNNRNGMFPADASYLIVGGLGGIGRAIASWMIQRGARNLIFATRRGPAADGASAAVEQLEKQGARIEIIACDVAEETQVDLLLETCAGKLPPIRGVIHSALVLKDALLQNMTVHEYRLGLRAKVSGAMNLHQKLPHDLDFFVLLSSLSGIIGNASQANYAAANTFLDAFAEYLNYRGFAGVALDLGVITGIGHVADNPHLAKAMVQHGFEGTNEEELLAMIQYAITHPHRPRGQNQIVSGLGTWNEKSVAAFERPMFSHFRRVTALTTGPEEQSEGNITAQIKALPVAEAAKMICNEIMAKASTQCMIPLEDVLPSRTLSSYGMDSLVAVEMRNWIFRSFNCTIPILELLTGNSIEKLSMRIAEKIE
ncbi:putative polyketide synthase [Pleomassaria siparia CBS 279.74]|uniref:Putative polyketide synthase n=1 Tax=Pleomassaria siparia CBS 279.74 TaxID=1314801 RepID=A0A6G1JRW6_9PLEO|nr:putative polyketide synthase [Pleomassaria siparia CBS 279.74]